MVSNKAIVNEETDPYLIIKKLKADIVALKAEIEFLKGEAVRAQQRHMHTRPARYPLTNLPLCRATKRSLTRPLVSWRRLVESTYTCRTLSSV